VIKEIILLFKTLSLQNVCFSIFLALKLFFHILEPVIYLLHISKLYPLVLKSQFMCISFFWEIYLFEILNE
jgi:hypothetical protein